MLLFGLLLPTLIAYNAHTKIETAQRTVEKATGTSFIFKLFDSRNELFEEPSDYSIVALADSERANLAVMINKQSMKLVVIYMGFSVMSFAMMFILLGFTDGPVNAVGEGGGIKVDVRFGSIGAAVFVVGAGMAAAGGLLKNEYETVKLPNFGGADYVISPEIDELMSGCAGLENEAATKECLRSVLK